MWAKEACSTEMGERMELYFFRHGATKGNLEKRYVGITDEELTGNAMEQLQEYQVKNTDWLSEIEMVVVSPMKRCRQTAEILFPEKTQWIAEEFRECDFGEFEYHNFRELDGNPAYQNFIDTMGRSGFPKGEDRVSFQKRCVEGLERWMPQIMQNQKVAFVVHGGTIMALFDQYSMPHRDYYDWQIGNGEGLVTSLAGIEENPDTHRLNWKFIETKRLKNCH